LLSTQSAAAALSRRREPEQDGRAEPLFPEIWDLQQAAATDVCVCGCMGVRISWAVPVLAGPSGKGTHTCDTDSSADASLDWY